MKGQNFDNLFSSNGRLMSSSLKITRCFALKSIDGQVSSNEKISKWRYSIIFKVNENLRHRKLIIMQIGCIWATSWENLLLPYANNKGTDQTAHPCSLISAFVVRCLDSITPLVVIFKNFKTLASLCLWAGWFEPYLVGNPEDRFSRGVSHFEHQITLRSEKFGHTKKDAIESHHTKMCLREFPTR